ncbi:MAG: DUF2071 domain-containing protein [Tepidisphaeraceae bacterium]
MTRGSQSTPGRWLSLFVAAVWICNGLLFKLLHVLPRHLTIVQSMPGLGGHRGEIALQCIGAGELLLAGWIISGRYPRACAAFQTSVLLSMNVLELIFARSHLLTPLGLVPINLMFLAVAWWAAELRSDDPFYRLRRHPFPVDAFFDHSLVLTYALPRQSLAPLLPPGLQVDAYGDYGFVAIAMVQTRRLRPAGFPRALGQDFILTGYRIFTTFHHAGRTRRGLFILRSDANRRLMVLMGNLLTHYQYRYSPAEMTRRGDALSVNIRTSGGAADLKVTADLGATDEQLPPGSVFTSAHDARRFAGPLPFTFDYEQATHSIVMIKGQRQGWSPRLVPVQVEQANFLEAPPFVESRPTLCSAFYVHDIPYRWLRGVSVRLES